jgi:hypothetical protein
VQHRFQGHIPYPPEQKIDDWGLNVEQQASRDARWCFKAIFGTLNACVMRLVVLSTSVVAGQWLPGCPSCTCQMLMSWCASTDFTWITTVSVDCLQETSVENFRRELEARNAWRREDHGRIHPLPVETAAATAVCTGQPRPAAAELGFCLLSPLLQG